MQWYDSAEGSCGLCTRQVRDLHHQPLPQTGAGFPKELIESGGVSRMADDSDVMTVRQLVELVAFLHSRYEFVPRTIR